MRPVPVFLCWSLLLFCLSTALASAQPDAPVGVRATGMGGAFTAVADDPSAVFWNPAGLATGAYFGAVMDHNDLDRRSATLIALSTPPLGLSYYRTATGELGNGRNSLVAHHAGATVVQSVGGRLAVGATLKLVRGVVSSDGSSISTNKFDTDIGVMTSGALGRLGLSVRNLLEPHFRAPGDERLTLERRVRAGLSLNLSRRLTAAADFDLTTASMAGGEYREIALGGEMQPVRGAWLRGGVHWNTEGETAAPIGTVGGSVAVYGSTMADAQVSFGSKDGNRGWGIGLRFQF
jgi:hypothetical protein